MIKQLQSLGKTVFLTTHYMDEAQYLADRVAIIARGLVVAEGPPDALIGGEDAVTSIRFRAPAGLNELGDGWPEGLPAPTRSEDGVVSIETRAPTRELFALTRWAVGRSLELTDLTVTRPSLEDVYLELVGGEASSEGAGEAASAGRGRRSRRRKAAAGS
jgi:ABC-2 type transport system ATP-binding protein